MYKTVRDIAREGRSDFRAVSEFDLLDEQLRDHLVEAIWMTFEDRWSHLAVAYLRRWSQAELEQFLEHLAGLDD